MAQVRGDIYENIREISDLPLYGLESATSSLQTMVCSDGTGIRLLARTSNIGRTGWAYQDIRRDRSGHRKLHPASHKRIRLAKLHLPDYPARHTGRPSRFDQGNCAVTLLVAGYRRLFTLRPLVPLRPAPVASSFWPPMWPPWLQARASARRIPSRWVVVSPGNNLMR